MHGSEISVERAHSELPLAEARSRFGGVDVPAILGGALAGLGVAGLLVGLAGAIGVGLEQPDAGTLAYASAAAGVVVVALAALAAGWVAGRAARFDGARNGLLAGLLMSLVLMGTAGAYSATDVGLTVSMEGDRLPIAIVAAVAALVVSGLTGALGGRLGTRWHRDVDDVLVGTRPGSVAGARPEADR